MLFKLLAWGTTTALVLVGWILSKDDDVFELGQCVEAVLSKTCHSALGLILITPVVFGSWYYAVDVLTHRCAESEIVFSQTQIRTYLVLVCSGVGLIVLLSAF
jgi:hypothetical protein